MQLVTRRQQRGAEVSAARLSEQLVIMGHTVHFVGLYPPPISTPVLSPQGCECHDLPVERKALFSFSTLRALKSLIRKLKPDLVQANGSDNLKYAVALKRSFPKLPLVYRLISMPGYWMRGNPLKIMLYRQLYARVDHIAGVGQPAIEELQSLMKLPPDRCSVIYRGIPMNQVDKPEARRFVTARLGIPSDAPLIMSAGALSPEKDQAFMLKALLILRNEISNSHLILVGEGPERGGLEQLRNEFQLNECVHLPGHQENLSIWLAAADLFWLSSKVEGVPGVILEAGIQQTPAVALNVGGVSEVIKHQKTGILIPSGDEENFVKSSISLLQSENQRLAIGKNAAELVAEKFSLSNSAKAFESLYLNLTS